MLHSIRQFNYSRVYNMRGRGWINRDDFNKDLATVSLLLFAPRWYILALIFDWPLSAWSFSLLWAILSNEKSEAEARVSATRSSNFFMPNHSWRATESSSCGAHSARVQRTHGIDILQSQSIFWSLESESRSVSHLVLSFNHRQIIPSLISSCHDLS